MCHTLVPNVTVDFTKYFGNAFALKWLPEFLSKVPSWKLYVHDKYEHVLLKSYAIETLATLTLTKPQTSEDGSAFLTKDYQHKAVITPKLVILPEPSKVLPCKEDEAYSRNLCYIKHGWKEKFKILENHFRDNFTCQLPGIKVLDGMQKPVCNTFYRQSTGALGLKDLTGTGDFR